VNRALADWEPHPFDLSGGAAALQEQGFRERAGKAILWTKVPDRDFPADGIFGRDKDWFASLDIEFFASCNGEDLVLIHHAWFGFPDPPEWGLLSRPAGLDDVQWSMWGYFPKLPQNWTVPIAFA
jgi:hypothetical protein